MNLKTLFLILLCCAAACSRSGPAKDSGDIPRAKALYQKVYAEYVTKSIHPGSAIIKLDQALGLVPEEHEYHRKILRLKTRIKEQQEPPKPPPEPDREEVQLIPPPEPPAETAGQSGSPEVIELLERGKKLVREKKLEEATELLEKAAGLAEHNCDVLASLGIVYARRRMREKSAKRYEEFIKHCPQHIQAPQIREILKQYNDFKNQGKR